MSTLTISCIQTALIWESPEANLAMFDSLLSSLGQTDVVVLPEMFSTGFTMHTALSATTPRVVHWMQAQAQRLQAVIAGSLITEDSGKFYNRFWWVFPDGTTHHYDKKHRFAYAGEDQHFEAGHNQVVITYKSWRIAPMVCYDLRFPVWARRTAAYDYDLLVYTANWPERRSLAWKTLLPARAVENQAYVIGVNRVGTDGNGLPYSGDSGIWGPTGQTLMQAPPFKTNVLTYTLNKATLDQLRTQFPFAADADRFYLEP